MIWRLLMALLLGLGMTVAGVALHQEEQIQRVEVRRG